MNIGSFRSIKTYAQMLKKRVKEIQEETGTKELILVGHSKGGLVISEYVTTLADDDTHITDAITIGSPLDGAPVGYLGIGHDAKEMKPGSPFITELRTKIAQNTKTRFYHIASKMDELVSLSSALFGKDRSRHFVLKDMGHLGLIFSSRVADQICRWLK